MSQCERCAGVARITTHKDHATPSSWNARDGDSLIFELGAFFEQTCPKLIQFQECIEGHLYDFLKDEIVKSL